MDNVKNLFISHFHGDDEYIAKFKALMSNRGVIVRNSSIDSTKPNRIIREEAIKRLLRIHMRWAGTFVCLIGPSTHTRNWVNWEIEEASKMGKRVIGVYLNGARDSDIPENFKLYGDALVGWTAEKILAAIDGQINNWEKSDGSIWENPFKLKTGVC